MSASKDREEPRTGNETKDRPLDRRSILLGGTTLAVASALSTGAPIRTAQAQAQPTPSGRRPNILVIFGDDIGQTNVSAYSCLIRWPGRIQPGSVSNELISALDWLPTLMAAVGEPNIKDKLLTGHSAGGKTFKVHLDRYNQLPHLTGQQERSARKEFIYFDDDGDLVALRYENWKVVFEEQRAQGTLRIWAEPFTKLRVPKLFNLRSDPYERADITSNTYYDWLLSDGAGLFVAAPAVVARFLATFKDYPPSQRPSSFSIDQIVEKMQRSFDSVQSR